MNHDDLEICRMAAIDVRRMECDLELMLSRIGGQSNGTNPFMSHSAILDPSRHIDDYLDAERVKGPEIRRLREGDIVPGEVLIGAARLYRYRELRRMGATHEEAIADADSMEATLRAHYVEACDPEEMEAMTGSDKAANDSTLRTYVAWLDNKCKRSVLDAIPTEG